MTKPWEETWTVGDLSSVEDALGRTVAITEWRRERDSETELPDRPEVARVLAAAPDLVRALLAVEWTWREGSERLRCAACDGEEPHESKPWRGGHTPTCATDAALRKAGVR